MPNYITSSRVDDGKCDCFDGSDESGVECPNTCAAKAQELNFAVLADIEEHEAGLIIQRQYISDFNSQKAVKEEQKKHFEGLS